MILSNVDIQELISLGKLVIEPLDDDTIRENGVDLKFSGKVGVLKDSEVFIPGESDPDKFYETMEMDEYVIKPGTSIIFSTIEYIRLPPTHIAFINLRSSYARLGLILSPTIVDAGYEGNLTVGLYSSRIPVLIKKGDRILHLIIASLKTKSSKPYSGIYKGVRGLAKPFTGK